MWVLGVASPRISSRSILIVAKQHQIYGAREPTRAPPTTHPEELHAPRQLIYRPLRKRKATLHNKNRPHPPALCPPMADKPVFVVPFVPSVCSVRPLACTQLHYGSTLGVKLRGGPFDTTPRSRFSPNWLVSSLYLEDTPTATTVAILRIRSPLRLVRITLESQPFGE